MCVCVNVLLKFCFPCRKTLKAEMCVCLDTLTEISRHQRSPAVCVVLWLTEELGCHSLQHQLQKLSFSRWKPVYMKDFQQMSPAMFQDINGFSLYLSIIDWMIRKTGTDWKTQGVRSRASHYSVMEDFLCIHVDWCMHNNSKNLTLNDNQVCNVNTI